MNLFCELGDAVRYKIEITINIRQNKIFNNSNCVFSCLNRKK